MLKVVAGIIFSVYRDAVTHVQYLRRGVQAGKRAAGGEPKMTEGVRWGKADVEFVLKLSSVFTPLVPSLSI